MNGLKDRVLTPVVSVRLQVTVAGRHRLYSNELRDRKGGAAPVTHCIRGRGRCATATPIQQVLRVHFQQSTFGLGSVPVAVCWPEEEIVNVAHAASFAWVPIAVAVMV